MDTNIQSKQRFYWETALENLSSAKDYAALLLKSDAVSRKNFHSPEDMLYVIQYGVELGLPSSQAPQVLIPKGGKMTMLGDAAKALVFGSGKILEWDEEVIDGGYSITSVRQGGLSITRQFTLKDAEKAGLLVTDEDVRKSPVLKNDPWYAYQQRMCYYRALGFLLRDLYADVMKGISLFEEVSDYRENQGVIVQTATGKEIKIQDAKEDSERSESLQKKAFDTSVKLEQTVEEIVEHKEDLESEILVRQLRPLDPIGMPESALAKMGNPMVGDFYVVIKDTIVEFLMEELPGKKTNAKARSFIVNIENDNIEAYLTKKYGEESLEILEKGREMIVRSNEPAPVVETQSSEELANIEAQDEAERKAKEEQEVPVRSFARNEEEEQAQNERTDVVAQNGNEGLHYEEEGTEEFEAGKGLEEVEVKSEPVLESSIESVASGSNPYNLEVPELEDGERDGLTIIDFMGALEELDNPLDHERYAMITKGLDIAKKYPDLDDLLEKATVEEINAILEENASFD